jgi:uncharacterized coiled-coil protein SlyX
LARREFEQRIATLTSQTFDQKTEIRLLEQRITSADARCAEHKNEANAHRSDAEAARASAVVLEDRLRQKELEFSSLRSKVQTMEATPTEPTTVVDPTLQARVSEQDIVIESLNSEIVAMKQDVETISERYRAGKLVGILILSSFVLLWGTNDML